MKPDFQSRILQYKEQIAVLDKKLQSASLLRLGAELKGEKILFNYKLTEGFCTDFNASALMKRSGIEILPDVL